jgi:hypothetical protein
MSAARKLETGTSSVRSPTTRKAVSGRSFANSFSAPCACAIERISIQWPRSMIVTSVDNSSHSGMPGYPSATAALKRNATEMARAMRVIIPGRRSRSSRIAPWTNTKPPYRKTAVPKTGEIHLTPGKCGAVYPNARCSMCPHTSVGIVRRKDSQNLRLNMAIL